MLLVDGNPHTLTAEERKRLSKKFKVMVPLSKVRRNKDMKNRIEPSQGQAITTTYNALIGGQQKTVRYYNNKRWDDTIRADVYSPEHIWISDAGYLDIENDPELAWFLHNHPGWSDNPHRKSVNGAQPFIKNDTMIQFRILNIAEGNLGVFEKANKLEKLLAASKKWSWQEMVGICHTLGSNHDATIPLPYQIVYYRDITEDQTEALRSALVDFATKEPVYLYDIIHSSMQAEISTAVHNLAFGENPKLKFNGETRVWELQEGKKEALKLYTVPDKDDPHAFLVKKATEDKSIGEKLIRLSANSAVTA